MPEPERPHLVTTWYGSFLLDPTGGPNTAPVREKRLFPQDPEAIADRLASMRSGAVLEEEHALLAKSDEKPRVYTARLRGAGWLVEPSSAPPHPALRPEESGYTATLLRDACLRLAVRETHAQMSERDRLIVQEVRALDEIIRAVNLLAERLREWYAIHAPEVVGRVREHSDLARLVATHGDRDKVAAAIEGLTPSALGVDLPEPDEAIVREFANGLATLYDTWQHIEKRLEVAMMEVAPTVATVAGPMLGARLISRAGGLTDLAIVPSGTVQTYGAENALFRHLKDGSPPPKHGVIYQHEAVHRAPWWHRGKIARALAGKISIAAKTDAFGGPPERGAQLLGEFQERLDQIRIDYKQPPKRRGARGHHRGRPGRAQGPTGAHGGGPGRDASRGARTGGGPRGGSQRGRSRPGHGRQGGPGRGSGGQPPNDRSNGQHGGGRS